MNYRRGLGRLYFVAAVAWVVLILATIPSGLIRVDFVEDLRAKATHVTSAQKFFGKHAQDDDGIPSVVWTWAVVIALVPPLLGYGVSFFVVPWIRQGFEHGKN